MTRDQRERAAAIVAEFKRATDTAAPGSPVSELRRRAAVVLEELEASKATGQRAIELLAAGDELLGELRAAVQSSSSPAPQGRQDAAPQAPQEAPASSSPASSSPPAADAPQAPQDAPAVPPGYHAVTVGGALVLVPDGVDLPFLTSSAPAAPIAPAAPAAAVEVLARSGEVLAHLTPPRDELAVSAPPRALEAIAAPPPGAVLARDVPERDRVREVRPELAEPESSRRQAVVVAVPAAAWDPRVTGVIVATSPGSKMDTSGARLAQVVATAPAPVVAVQQATRDPLDFADDPRPTIAIEAGASGPRATGAVAAIEAQPAQPATAAIASSPASSSPASSSPAPANPDAPPIARARGLLDQINGSAANLQRAALELSEDNPQRAALLEQASRLRQQAAAMYADLA